MPQCLKSRVGSNKSACDEETAGRDLEQALKASSAAATDANPSDCERNKDTTFPYVLNCC